MTWILILVKAFSHCATVRVSRVFSFSYFHFFPECIPTHRDLGFRGIFNVCNLDSLNSTDYVRSLSAGDILDRALFFLKNNFCTFFFRLITMLEILRKCIVYLNRSGIIFFPTIELSNKSSME